MKEIIQYKLEEYSSVRLSKSNEIIISTGAGLIKPGDKILVFGLNQNFKNIFSEAANRNINFSIVYIVNTNSFYSTLDLESDIEYLSKTSVPVTYSYIVSASVVISEVTKVFLRAESMLSNGSFLGEVGNSMIANIAYNFKKPVIVFCETFKFWDKIQINPFCCNNQYLSYEKSVDSVNRLEINYDITPSRVLNMVVCEMGYIPPSSVKVVIREYVCDEIEV